MDTQQHYPKPPITEAIIDLRVELPSNSDVEQLKKAHDGKAYPEVKPLRTATGHLEVGKQVSTTATSKQIGYWFRSANGGHQIYQARLDGFTMSRLAPYERWQPFRDEARRLWNVYKAAVDPQRVVRLAVRYINRIDMPLPLDDFKDYLRTCPEVSGDLPQGLAGYFMRLQMPLDDIQSLCLLNEAIIEPAAPNVVSVALDIDLFRTANLPDDDEAIWGVLEQLRARKNSVFEACITDRARELFR